MMAGARGFGVAGALDQEIVREVARAAEVVGFRTFWANDTPGGDGLAALAAAAEVTSTIRLAVGVLPLDRQSPERIASRVRELALPTERLTLGVGSGGARDALALVREGVPRVREGTGATVVVGALGPRMCALAGEVADGALLNWLTPEYADRSVRLVREAAAGPAEPRVDGYVRTGLNEAVERVREEGERYAGFPSYAAHFARMGVEPLATCAVGVEAEVRAKLAAFDDAVDEVVVRAITPEETSDAYLALVAACAPRSTEAAD